MRILGTKRRLKKEDVCESFVINMLSSELRFSQKAATLAGCAYCLHDRLLMKPLHTVRTCVRWAGSAGTTGFIL